ncbi:MAG: thiamine-phosphate kinase [Opitutales bacterium]
MASPFTDQPEQSLAALGEVDLIQRIRTLLGAACPPGTAGGGDDCAVPAWPPGFDPDRTRPLLTVDALIYGRHFDDQTEAAAAGAKLVNRNLSDIAAMGGQPGWSVVSLACDGRLRLEWLDAFCRGMSRATQAVNLQLNGGDVSGADRNSFIASMTIVGWADQPVPRQGARPGDRLLVSGRLGGSLLGHHLTFTPRLQEGAWLAGRPEIRAMIDVTDGLAKDLPALRASGGRVHVNTSAIPLSAAAGEQSKASGKTALWHACNDGEDYELAIAVEADQTETLLADWGKAFPELPLTAIGQVTDEQPDSDCLIDARTGKPLFEAEHRGGFRHFG